VPSVDAARTPPPASPPAAQSDTGRRHRPPRAAQSPQTPWAPCAPARMRRRRQRGPPPAPARHPGQRGAEAQGVAGGAGGGGAGAERMRWGAWRCCMHLPLAVSSVCRRLGTAVPSAPSVLSASSGPLPPSIPPAPPAPARSHRVTDEDVVRERGAQAARDPANQDLLGCRAHGRNRKGEAMRSGLVSGWGRRCRAAAPGAPPRLLPVPP
jgi:hypothetical protein